MNPEIEQFLNKKKAEELDKKKKAILQAVRGEYSKNIELYASFIKRDVSSGIYQYSFVNEPTEEEINALYDYFHSKNILSAESEEESSTNNVKEKVYKVKNGWLTFIGVVLLIELIIGIIWAIAVAK